MSQEMSSAMLRILKARERVARRNVFFASILYNARLVERDVSQGGHPTMATDGINVYFHPEFVKKNDQYIEGVLLHEVLHCALDHGSRRQHRDHRVWNIACDYAINPLVVSVYKLPPEGLMDPKFNDLSAEAIYTKLESLCKKNGKGQKGKGQKSKSQKGDEQGDPDGDGDCGDEESQESSGSGKPCENCTCMPQEGSARMLEPASQDELEEAQREWERVVKMAADRAEKAGQMHGALKRLIEEIFPSDKIDWRLLIDDMARDARSEVTGSWARPNRRFIGEGVYLPGYTKENVFRLVLCIDSSGSVTAEQLKAMKAEAMSLLEQEIVTHVTMISTDTRVCNIMDVSNADEVAKFSLGNHGGGTDFKDAMEAVAKVEDAVGCIFMTDMQTNSFGADPGIPTVWVDFIKSGAVAPFGKTVQYN